MTQASYIPRAVWEGEGPLTKFTIPQRKIDEPGRRITFTISTAARDRDGDIIDQAGWDLEDYKKNPVILWAHDGSQPPIARAETVSVENSRLVSIARFATREEYAFSDTIFQLYKGGFLNATSVGFQPTEMELIEGETPGDFGFRFTRQKLMEYSAVPVPSNPEALVVARGVGIDVKPCENWIERILDEHKGGSIEGLLNRSFIALRGKLHPVMQAAIAEKNAAALRKRDKMPEDPTPPEPDDDEEVASLTTAPGGDDNHTHNFAPGGFQTEPAEDGHIHAISYDDDGEAYIEGAEGHGHDAPTSADVGDEKNGDVNSEAEVSTQTPVNHPDDPREGEPKEQREAEAEVAKVITDWPADGMSLPVSLLTSEYRTFPVAEAKALREDWPELWALGDGPGEIADEDAIRAREAWAAKNVDGYQLQDVVSQVRHLVRGSRGIEYMRAMLSKAKEHVMNNRDKAKGLTPEQIEAITDRVVDKAVIPALQKAIRHHSGRVS